MIKVKKSLLISILLVTVSTINIKAQIPDVFPVSGVEWGCRYHTTDPWNPFYSDVYFKSEFDTLLNGVQYTFVQDYASVPRLIRVEDQKVYAKFMSACCESAEFLLYDFSLNAGDSTTIYGYSGEPDPYPAYIESVDSLFVGGTYHKRLHVKSDFQDFDFVQGIGALQGVFYCDLPMTDWMCDLTCFSINGTAYALDGSGETWDVSCWETIDNKVPENTEITVIPNPAQEMIRFSLPEIYNVEIYNAIGVKVITSTEAVINISHLNKGIYIAKVYYDKNSNTTIRFLKN